MEKYCYCCCEHKPESEFPLGDADLETCTDCLELQEDREDADNH